ncbi:MAG: hypothetical protein AAFX50_19985, partial [Acidobacteriota bacterium]
HLPFTTGEDLGRRARVGVVALSSDYTIEHELGRLLDLPGVGVYTARLPNSPEVTPETLAAMQDHIADTAARILILDGGRLCFDGAPDALIDSTHGRVFERLLSDAELRDFSTRYRVTTRVRTLDGVRVRAVATVDQAPAGEIVRPNLEEAYLATLGHGVHAPGGERRTGSLLDLDA